MEYTNKNGREVINTQLIEEHKMIQTPNVLKNEYSKSYASVLWLNEQISDTKIEGYIQLLKQKNYISIQTSSNAGNTIKVLKSSESKLDFLIISGIRRKEIVENIYKDINIASYFKIIVFGEPEKFVETFKRVKLITNDIAELENYISHWFFKLRRRRRFTGEKKDIILPFELNPEKFFKNYGRYLTEWAGIRFNKSEIAGIESVGMDAGVSAEDIKEVIQAYKKENPLRMYSMDNFLYEELNKKLRIKEKNIKIIPFACKLNAQLLKNQHFIDIGLRLYRGVELDQNAIGHFQEVAHTDQEIIFPAFTSTSAFKEIVLSTFMDNVIFKISFLPNPDIKIYPVSIKEHSEYTEEEELLFPMGSKFLVQNVIKDEEELIYQIDLLYNGVAYPPVIIDEERAENLIKETTVARDDQALREKVEIKSEIERNEILSQITRLRSVTKNTELEILMESWRQEIKILMSTELERESMSKSEEMYRAALGREKDRKLVMEQEMFEQHKILHAAKITPRALAKIPVQVYPLGNWESFLITLFEGYKVYIYLYIYIYILYLPRLYNSYLYLVNELG